MKTRTSFIHTAVLRTAGAVFFLLIAFSCCAAVRVHAGTPELPVINITSDTSYNDIYNEYVPADMELTSPDHAPSELYSGTAYLHLRGNSTAGLLKKPFKLKLENKADLLGMGRSRHWVLLANAIDLTNIRNLMMQRFATSLGLTSMSSRLVELYYNGTYKGVYELCEQVRIGKTRVDIYDWEDLAEDVADAVTDGLISKGLIPKDREDEARAGIRSDLKKDYAWATDSDHTFYLTTVRDIAGRDYWKVDLAEYHDFSDVPDATGGALIEMDFYHNGSADLKTAYRLPLYLTAPDYTGSNFDALEDYMRDYIQAAEYAMHSTDFVYRASDTHYRTTDEGRYSRSQGRRLSTAYGESDFYAPVYDGMHYSNFVDIDSAINNMLVCELSDNWDCMKNSFFMYKDIDSKLVFGPAWDFDWAWGNSMYGIDTAGMWNGTYTYARKWQTTNDYFANEQYYQTQQFNRLLVKDPYFVVKLYERYREVRESLILPFADEYESMCESLKVANGKNYTLWRRTDSSGGGAGRTYNEQLTHTLDFIRQRISWLDEQFADPQTLIDSFGYYKASDSLTVREPDTVSSPGNVLISVDVTGSIAAETAAVSFQINGRTFITATVADRCATASVPVSVLTDEPGIYSTVVCRAVDAAGSYIKNSRGTEPGVYTNAHSGYIVIDETKIGAAAGGIGEGRNDADGSGDAGSNPGGTGNGSADTDNGRHTDTSASAGGSDDGTSADGSFRPFIIAAIAAAFLAVIALTALIIAKKHSKRS